MSLSSSGFPVNGFGGSIFSEIVLLSEATLPPVAQQVHKARPLTILVPTPTWNLQLAQIYEFHLLLVIATH